MPACWVFMGKLSSKISEYTVSWLSYAALVLNHRYRETTLWLQGRDSNPRPPAYEAGELTDCSTLRYKLGWGSYPLLRACKRCIDLRPPIPRPNGGYTISVRAQGTVMFKRSVYFVTLSRPAFVLTGTGHHTNEVRFFVPSIMILLYHKNFFTSRKRKSSHRSTRRRARQVHPRG